MDVYRGTNTTPHPSVQAFGNKKSSSEEIEETTDKRPPGTEYQDRGSVRRDLIEFARRKHAQTPMNLLWMKQANFLYVEVTAPQ